MAYLSVRGNASRPLFMLQDGRPLSRVLPTDWLRQISTIGISGNFCSHSFLIGAATVAARNGVQDHLIQSLGRWSSNVYQLYIRTRAEALTSLSPWPKWFVALSAWRKPLVDHWQQIYRRCLASMLVWHREVPGFGRTSDVCPTSGLGSPFRFRDAWGCWGSSEVP